VKEIHLMNAFQGHFKFLRVLRNTDSEFDSICSDFEEVSSILASIKESEKTQFNSLSNDLAASREGLREEIRERLRLTFTEQE
jgi:hypothetical protein